MWYPGSGAAKLANPAPGWAGYRRSARIIRTRHLPHRIVHRMRIRIPGSSDGSRHHYRERMQDHADLVILRNREAKRLCRAELFR